MKINSKAKRASAILIAVLGLFYWANSVSLKDTQNGHKSLFRFPASHIFGQERSASVAVEKRYAADLALVKKRKLASIAHSASPLENFRFGELEGKYHLTLDGDKVAAVSFIDTPDSTGSPTILPNRADFITKHARLFGVTGSPQRVAVDLKGTHVVETYKVKLASGTESKIKITLDDSDRLLDLQTEKSSSLKIF
jgi:hypothetical protein